MLSMNAAFQTFLELPPLAPFSPFPSLLFFLFAGDHWAAHLVVVLPSSVGCSQVFCDAPSLYLMISLMLPLSGGVLPPSRWCSLQCAHTCVLRGMRPAGWLLPQIFLELPHTCQGHGQRSPWAGKDRQWTARVILVHEGCWRFEPKLVITCRQMTISPCPYRWHLLASLCLLSVSKQGPTSWMLCRTPSHPLFPLTPCFSLIDGPASFSPTFTPQHLHAEPSSPFSLPWLGSSFLGCSLVSSGNGRCLRCGPGSTGALGVCGSFMHLKVKPNLNKAKSSVTPKNSAGRTLLYSQPSGNMVLPALGLRAPSILASLFCGDSRCHLLILSQPQNPALNRLAVWTGLTLLG